MRKYQLVSHYTKASYKKHSNGYNEASTPNLLDRHFNRDQKLDVVVSDLTYVRVGRSWCYVCLIIDLWNREIIGWSAEKRKNANLVYAALQSIPYRLDQINLFHSDRGREFDNILIDEVLAAFDIERSLSHKGCPYDNAVIESTNHILKTEFIYQHKFQSLTELQAMLSDYIRWYNTKRIHGSLGYLSPLAYKQLTSSPVN